MSDIITVKGLNRIFPISGGELHVLKDITFSVPEKGLAILKGRSGSGKTTLINLLGALDTPTSGEIIIAGNKVSEMSESEKELLRRKTIGFVFQSVSLIPMMSAYENVEFALRLAGVKEGRKERATQCLKMVGLAGRMHHMPAEMSGGEQQRVAIARAIAHKPKVIFADEPTAELDSAMAAKVTEIFKQMSEEEGIAILMTTHDVGLMGAADMLIELENGERINA